MTPASINRQTEGLNEHNGNCQPPVNEDSLRPPAPNLPASTRARATTRPRRSSRRPILAAP
eukprot:4749656-Pleurochrysis_carterae.AAC.4